MVMEKIRKISMKRTTNNTVVLLYIYILYLYIVEQGSRSARLSPQSMIHYARKLFIKQPYNILCKVFHNIGNDRMTRQPDDQITR